MGKLEQVGAISAAKGGIDAKLLVADLDGTILRTDLLYESLVALACSRPWRLPGLIPHLLKGKAAFKRALVLQVSPDLDSLPCNEALLAWLRERRAEGHRIVLYSASDQLLVEGVARRFGLFDEAHGSDGFTNLSGKAKYDAIAQRHAGQFTYIGDSRSDLEIWSRCRSAVLAGRGEHLRSRLNEDVEVVAEFPCAEAKLATWRRALRLHQWAKNALIFIPLLLSGMFTDARSVLLAFTAFIAFGLLASATYLVNDLFDLPNDRRHRVKRNRPLASGELPLQRGVAAIPLLLLAASAVMSLLPHKFAGVAVLYAVVTLAYSIIFKRQPILDVLVLAGLFTFRLLAGIVAVGTLLSPWLLAFSMFFFGSLATIKRYTECDTLLKEGRHSIPGRGYRPEDAAWLMTMGAACGFASILVFFIYLVDAVTLVRQFHQPAWLWSICPILAYWLGRVWLLASRGEMREDPIAFALRDRVSLILGVIVALSVCLAVF